ncbi:MAG TPA: response regulator [Longimicrobiales bacterium]
MSVLEVANWSVLLAFFGGAALGLLVGWLLRAWREPAKSAGNAAAKRPTAVAEAAATQLAPRRTTTPPRIVDAEYDEFDSRPAILLIDDRLEMLGIHAAYLQQHGYRTLLADSGTSGLAFARHYRPALIVLDQSMPDRTGIEVTRELKSDPATAHIPILLMTALSYGAVGAAALEAGVDAYLSKPIEPSRLLREIEARTRPPKH